MVFGGSDYDEKRGFHRMGIECPMTFKVDGAGDKYVGTALDLSATGVRIESPVEVSVGTTIHINIAPDQAIVPPLSATVEVLRVDRNGDGSFDIGGEIREMQR